MRRYTSAVAVTALLLAGGFAAASIASGGGLKLLPTTGTASTSTVSHKQTLCHRTHSKKKPFRTISVDAHAVPAHLRHGDTLGACSQSQLAAGTSKTNKGKKKGSSSSSTNTSSTNGPSHGNGNGNGHGNNGNGHGNGNGKK